MHIRQFVVAYGVEQDRLRAMLPAGFCSLRPVLRLNGELREDRGWLELNTPAEHDGLRGWLNVARWEDAAVTREGNAVTFRVPGLWVRFTGTGLQGGCPAEKDNAGCWTLSGPAGETFRPAETITAKKEFCDCAFSWDNGNGGVSQGKTLPAFPEEQQRTYPPAPLTAGSAAAIPCIQVLGAYTVELER